MAYAMACATSGVTDCVHVDAGGVISSPLALTIRSIATGVHVMPLFAMPANPAAMVSGASSCVPSTSEGFICSSPPSARCMPNAWAVCLILQRSSCWAIAMKAVFTEYFVALTALLAFVPSSLRGLKLPDQLPVQLSVNEVKVRRDPLNVSVSE